jgi:hypothetical protein
MVNSEWEEKEAGSEKRVKSEWEKLGAFNTGQMLLPRALL